MNKIEELEAKLMAERIKVQIDLNGKFPKEKATEEQLKHVGYKNLIR